MACQVADPSPDSVEGYAPPQCLWTLVKQNVPKSELPEIRAVVGEALVDLYTELYSEMETWVEIWREARGKQGARPRTPRPTLADPPAIKELLRDEIRLLLLNVRDVASGEGRDGNTVTSKFSPRVVSYAMAGRQQESAGRPLELSDSISAMSRSSSRLSSSSTGEEDIQAMKDKLSVSTIDGVVSRLKSVFAEECETLKREVQFLQDCVEKCFLDHSEELVPEPSISELKQERRRIERELQLRSQTPCCRRPDRAAVDGGLTYGLRTTQQMAQSATDLLLQSGSASPAPNSVSQPLILPAKHSAEHLLPHGTVNQTPLSAVLGSSGHADESIRNGCSNLGSEMDIGAVKDHAPRPDSSTLAPSSAAVEVRPCKNFNARLRRVAADPHRSVTSDCGPRCAQPLPPVSRAAHTAWLSSRPFLPSPPKTQRPASRGQSATRRLRLLEANSLVSPT